MKTTTLLQSKTEANFMNYLTEDAKHLLGKDINILEKMNDDDFYYAPEFRNQFLSASTVKNYLKCEAMAYATEFEGYDPFKKWNGRTGSVEKDETALLVGNYIHSYFESEEAHQRFLEMNEEKIWKVSRKFKKFTKIQVKEGFVAPDGTIAEEGGEYLLSETRELYADFKKADRMIERMKENDFFMDSYVNADSCLKEVPFIHPIRDINGDEHWFIGKADGLDFEHQTIHDIKTSADLTSKTWGKVEMYDDETHSVVSYEQWLPFFMSWHYDTQLAIYSALCMKQFGFIPTVFFHGISKKERLNVSQDGTTFDCYSFTLSEEEITNAMKVLMAKLPEIKAVREGKRVPKRCGCCEYCQVSDTPNEPVTSEFMWRLANTKSFV